VSPTRGAVESFRTHANYLRAFATLAGFESTLRSGAQLDGLARKAAAFPVPHVTPGPPDDVFACLRRAWGAELLLNVGRRLVQNEDELLRLANSWGAVQTYYAAYGAVQALIVAEGYNRPQSHPATQTQASDLWVNRGAVLIPWSFAVGSAGVPGAAASGCINGPGRVIDASLHAWTACTPATCWDLAAVALRSTRQDSVNARLKQKRKDKLARRKKEWQSTQEGRLAIGKTRGSEPKWPHQASLTPSEAAAAAEAVRPYTLLDYLYRLRIKANYEDAGMFTDGPQELGESAWVARDLAAITAATLIVHEVRIARLIGKEGLIAEARQWIHHNSPPAPAMGVAMRIDILDANL
jgi:hypothetical protein